MRYGSTAGPVQTMVYDCGMCHMIMVYMFR